jgi:alkanesulfonate monooxygenase SsuD/methylene tetrahydromethanopterin reductase-like flavin-dependent oxidoreductase (luciferase family)
VLQQVRRLPYLCASDIGAREDVLMTHPFRFGLVTAPRGTGEQWIATARRAAGRGYGTLLVPDGLAMHAPMPALAVAATAVPSLRVCPFVLAAPLRTPRAVAWEAHSMSALTHGRFELGLGTGRPQAAEEAAQLGMPWGSGAQRLDRARETVAAVRALDPDRRIPLLIAAAGPRALALAAAEADVVTLAAPPSTPRQQVGVMADRVRQLAGPRAAQLELSMNVFVVGDEVPPFMAGFVGDPAALAGDTLAFLRGSPREMADELRRRRDGLGLTYFAVGEAFADRFAPVVELLAGRAD